MSQPRTDTLWTTLVGGFFSSMAYLIGGVDNLAIAFGVAMMADWITGVLEGFYSGKLSSKRSYKGIAKKAGMIVFVIFANQLDIISGNESGFLRNALILVLIGTEGISITENLGKMDILIPAFMKKALEQLRGREVDGKPPQQETQVTPITKEEEHIL